MKRVLLFLMIVGLTTMSVFSQKKETRSVSGFTGINASSAFDITVTKGDTESLVIEAADDVMPYIRSEVRNGILHLYLDSNRLRNIRSLKASIVMKNLDKVTLSGASKLTADDLFTADKFMIDCSGASKMAANVTANQLNVKLSGASNLQIKANVNGDAGMDMSGASKVKGDLKANDVKINFSGACSAELSGSANDLKIDTSGASKIKADNFAVKTATVRSSGSSNVTVNASDALKVNASGVASIDYKGSPTLDVNSSKTVRVRKI